MRKHKIIVGLGNPGSQYSTTRHNIGFMTLGTYADRLGRPSRSKKTKSYLRHDFDLPDYELTLIWPLLYMNLSGNALLDTGLMWEKHLENTLVVLDDAHLDFGQVRFRKNGTAGGQKGLANIIERLGTNNIYRLKLGIGSNPVMDLVDYVLSSFTPEERKFMPALLSGAADAIHSFVESDIDVAMREFNNKSLIEKT